MTAKIGSRSASTAWESADEATNDAMMNAQAGALLYLSVKTNNTVGITDPTTAACKVGIARCIEHKSMN